MAYKQTPGRGNNKKTGYCIPQVFDQSPVLQAKNKKTSLSNSLQEKEKYNISQSLEDKINATTLENKDRERVENQAKIDSTTAYNARGGTKRQNAFAGWNAANATRINAGYGDMRVNQGRETSAPYYTTFHRENKVHKNMPTAVYNKKTGLYDNDPNENLFAKAKGWITTAFENSGFGGWNKWSTK